MADQISLESLEHGSIPRLEYHFELQRRQFFKLLGGGVLICLCAPAGAQESGARPQPSNSEEPPKAIDAWLHLGEDGLVTVYTGKVEVGQNIRTSLSQQVAEELRVPFTSVRLVMGDTDLTPFDMGTFGSRSTPQMGSQLRKVAASAREVLITTAAELWHTNPASLAVEDGNITNTKTGQTVSFANLAKGQQVAKLVNDDPPLTPPERWKIAGTLRPKVNGRDFVTGAHKYTSDMSRPGMLRGKVLRPSAFKASLESVDTTGADKLPGVTVVRDGELVGVVAADETSAHHALAAIRPQWKAPQQPLDSEIFEYFRKNVRGSDGPGGNRNDSAGSVEQALATADKSFKQTYTVAYIAHVPLEPRAAVAEWNDGKLTVWTGTQRPFGVRTELSETFRIPLERVRVIVPDTGSAYGGKHMGDAAIEAARLAKAAGKPVKLVWTREEEFTWAYFRPGGVIDVRSGVRNDGTIVAWEFDNYNSGASAITTPYNIANRRIEFHPADSPLRQGSYRGLAATANHFARESHMDELAHALAIDPLQFRLKNLTNDRLRAVFEAAAERFGWGRDKSSPERGFGIAGGVEKGGYLATCAEVAIVPEGVRVRRVVQAFDCGAVMNPGGLKNQVEGAAVQALGGALFEAVHFGNGRILNPHLAQYRVPRFGDAPQIEVVLIDRKDQPSMGAGETPIVGLAPAVGNAIFAATGTRLRSLPLVPNGVPKNTASV